MHRKRLLIDLSNRLMAWSAMAMLFLQPLALQAHECNCRAFSHNEVEAKGCCESEDSAQSCCETQTDSCCSTREAMAEPICNCGEQCCCSVGEPEMPMTPVPVEESQNGQTRTLALMVNVLSNSDCRSEKKICLNLFQVHRPAQSAQETCALLSRFIV